ncbi:MAG: UbiA family prenyltransferase [Deltaproteobacteria bacterium]|nr:UbiA family prenyltransferase [Deltaproteobacteria bacterium]
MPDEKPKALALDLDGTLLGTDSLWELFFKALSQGRLAPLWWLFCGRLRFKRKLAESTELDLDLLPWNEKVIGLAREHGAKGGEVWLATAANQAVARKVAGRFGFFTGHMATDARINLKSEAKARALADRFGEGGFIYAGDCGADVKVWRAAGGAVVVGGERLARLARPMGGEVRVVEPVGTKWPSPGMVMELAGAKKCLAGLVVFLPMLLALAFSPANVLNAVLAFAAFWFVGAAGNALGELLGLEADRKDPRRKGRTLAAGRLDLSRGGFVFLGFALAGLAFAALARDGVFALALIALALTVLHAQGLRKYLALSLFAQAAVNTLALACGYVALGLPASPWGVTLAFLAFAALGAMERLSDLGKGEGEVPVVHGLRVGRVAAARAMSVLAPFLVLAFLDALTFPLTLAPAGAFARPGWALLAIPAGLIWFWRLYARARAAEGPLLAFSLTDGVSWLAFGLALAGYFLSGPAGPAGLA